MRPVNNYLFIENVEQPKPTEKEMREAVLYVPPSENQNVREFKVLQSTNLKSFPLDCRVVARLKDVIDINGFLAVKEQDVIGVKDA